MRQPTLCFIQKYSIQDRFDTLSTTSTITSLEAYNRGQLTATKMHIYENEDISSDLKQCADKEAARIVHVPRGILLSNL
ncbi:hypothetical protein L596_029884 [Steinernema carpocapsae]|uniref:Uncharacterized protein n=1 Tax=Steinernema carpocapsae TaxID=34508 RepID=A0A4U5LR37_STECR|nr:hypothetical protein L596_029884 [Steinernema carpocapsae]